MGLDLKDCTVCTDTKRWEMVDVLFAGLSKERMERLTKVTMPGSALLLAEE